VYNHEERRRGMTRDTAPFPAPSHPRRAPLGPNRRFRTYKIPEGKGENKFAFDGKWLPRKDAIEIIMETHEQWRRTVDGNGERGGRGTAYVCRDVSRPPPLTSPPPIHTPSSLAAPKGKAWVPAKPWAEPQANAFQQADANADLALTVSTTA
jgi:hypothetical protein